LFSTLGFIFCVFWQKINSLTHVSRLSGLMKMFVFFIRSLFNSRSNDYNMSAAIIGADIRIQLLTVNVCSVNH
jgi:hypothetical protein